MTGLAWYSRSPSEAESQVVITNPTDATIWPDPVHAGPANYSLEGPCDAMQRVSGLLALRSDLAQGRHWY